MLPSFDRLALRPAVAVTGNGMDDGTDSDAMDDDMMPESSSVLPNLSDLPEELWEKILAAIETDNPCDEIVKLCALNQKWASMCRSGELYDVASRALGWYGKQGTWMGVLALYSALKVHPPGDGTPKAYFQAACRAPFDSWLTKLPVWHPFYEARLLAFARKHPDQLDTATLPRYLSNYEEIARTLVNHNYRQLLGVDTDLPAFKQIVLDAIDNTRGRALEDWQYFENRPDFEEVITIAVERYGWNALRWVENNLRSRWEFLQRLNEIAGPRPANIPVPFAFGGAMGPGAPPPFGGPAPALNG